MLIDGMTSKNCMRSIPISTKPATVTLSACQDRCKPQTSQAYPNEFVQGRAWHTALGGFCTLDSMHRIWMHPEHKVSTRKPILATKGTHSANNFFGAKIIKGSPVRSNGGPYNLFMNKRAVQSLM